MQRRTLSGLGICKGGPALRNSKSMGVEGRPFKWCVTALQQQACTLCPPSIIQPCMARNQCFILWSQNLVHAPSKPPPFPSPAGPGPTCGRMMWFTATAMFASDTSCLFRLRSMCAAVHMTCERMHIRG